jgi:uncharacterized protein (TIGR00251 family)
MPPAIHDSPAGVVIEVKVMPRSSRNRIDGIRGDRLLVRLTAPPVEGAANDALREVLGRALGIPATLIQIAAGSHSRQKRVVIPGVAAADVAGRLALPSEDSWKV